MSASEDHQKSAKSHLEQTLERISSPAPTRSGKVREIFEKQGELFLVTTDRISAFDVVLGTVPFKGAMLTTQAAHWLSKTEDIVPNHLMEQVDPQILRCRKAELVPVEFVVRGFLAGSLAREKENERGARYGLRIDPGMKPYQAFDEPIITPTTKAEAGAHDEPCSLAEVVAQRWASQKEVDALSEIALALFARGQKAARSHGLILADCKYEFGRHPDVPGGLILIDELHTADSARYWDLATFDERVGAGEVPQMLDKERLRRWLAERGFTGEGKAPVLDPQIRVDLCTHYWELTERLIEGPFDPPLGDATQRVVASLKGLGF
jgi:phosphoribosylaminoimidazole-succinocarboxamide synthase